MKIHIKIQYTNTKKTFLEGEEPGVLAHEVVDLPITTKKQLFEPMTQAGILDLGSQIRDKYITVRYQTDEPIHAPLAIGEKVGIRAEAIPLFQHTVKNVRDVGSRTGGQDASRECLLETGFWFKESALIRETEWSLLQKHFDPPNPLLSKDIISPAE